MTGFDKNFITFCYPPAGRKIRFHRQNGVKQAKNHELLTFSTEFFTGINVFHYTNGKCQKLSVPPKRIFARAAANNMVAFEANDARERNGMMIKGINRQVIEINETDGEYFEKVMFFVKPECAGVSEGKLRERANAMAETGGKPPATRIARSRLARALWLLAAAAGGAVVSAALTLLLR